MIVCRPVPHRLAARQHSKHSHPSGCLPRQALCRSSSLHLFGGRTASCRPLFALNHPGCCRSAHPWPWQWRSEPRGVLLLLPGPRPCRCTLRRLWRSSRHRGPPPRPVTPRPANEHRLGLRPAGLDRGSLIGDVPMQKAHSASPRTEQPGLGATVAVAATRRRDLGETGRGCRRGLRGGRFVLLSPSGVRGTVPRG